MARRQPDLLSLLLQQEQARKEAASQSPPAPAGDSTQPQPAETGPSPAAPRVKVELPPPVSAPPTAEELAADVRRPRSRRDPFRVSVYAILAVALVLTVVFAWQRLTGPGVTAASPGRKETANDRGGQDPALPSPPVTRPVTIRAGSYVDSEKGRTLAAQAAAGLASRGFPEVRVVRARGREGKWEVLLLVGSAATKDDRELLDVHGRLIALPGFTPAEAKQLPFSSAWIVERPAADYEPR
jgi:hypothetical protein